VTIELVVLRFGDGYDRTASLGGILVNQADWEGSDSIRGGTATG